MAEHYVTIRVDVDANHVEVGNRVLSAVVKEFQDRSKGGIEVRGFDRAKLERERDTYLEERNYYANESIRKAAVTPCVTPIVPEGDRLGEIRVALGTIESPWFSPDETDPPEDDLSGKEDKTIFGSDRTSKGFEGGGFLVIGHTFRSADRDFAAKAPERLEWAAAEIERLRGVAPPVRSAAPRTEARAGVSASPVTSVKAKPLAGKIFVVTGTLPKRSRDEAKEWIKDAGGTVSEAVHKKVSFLLAGEKPGSKLAKAKELGVEVLTEERLEAMLRALPGGSSK